MASKLPSERLSPLSVGVRITGGSSVADHEPATVGAFVGDDVVIATESITGPVRSITIEVLLRIHPPVLPAVSIARAHSHHVPSPNVESCPLVSGVLFTGPLGAFVSSVVNFHS